MFVHYTKSVDIIGEILKIGLFINKNPRSLMPMFSDKDCFTDREPQDFGMACVRKERFFGSKSHCDQFGYFGIEFSKQWIMDNEFKPVIYINNLNSNRFQKLLKEAITEFDLINKYPDDGYYKEALFNKHIARLMGAYKLADWLEMYEYMEHEKNKNQNEWRYVQPRPLYTTKNSSEILKISKHPSWHQRLRFLPFTHSDITRFITDKKHEGIFSDWISANCSHIPLKVRKYL